MTYRTIFLTLLAMLAFAGNSLLCRAALAGGAIDAAGFTLLRVVSGALFLAVLIALRRGGGARPFIGMINRKHLPDAISLAAYMLFFSFAYTRLDTGTGALLLFGAVQITMFLVALRDGEQFSGLSWAGLALAFGGLAWLVSPGVTAPDLIGAIMMIIAGIGWGIYSLTGRGARDALGNTARNFLLCIPLIVIPALLFIDLSLMSLQGILLSITSGVVASGCGYAIWYAVLPSLGAGRAATIQLTVPAISAFGGVILLGEAVSLRLVLASIIILGGVLLVIIQRQRN